MSVELKELDGLQRSFHITVPADAVDSAYKKHMAEVAKNANIQGFRKGKVPEHVIEMQPHELMPLGDIGVWADGTASQHITRLRQ